MNLQAAKSTTQKLRKRLIAATDEREKMKRELNQMKKVRSCVVVGFCVEAYSGLLTSLFALFIRSSLVTKKRCAVEFKSWRKVVL